MRRILAILSCLASLARAEFYLFATEAAEVSLKLAGSRPGVSYRGNYAGTQVFVSEGVPGVSEGVVREIDRGSMLLHIRPASLDPAVFPDFSPKLAMQGIRQALSEDVESRSQVVLSRQPTAQLLWESATGAFYAIAENNVRAVLDQLLAEPYVVPVLVAPYDLPWPATTSSLDLSRRRLRQKIASLSFQSIIDRVAGSIESKDLRSIVRHLTGEDGRASWKTRHSFTTGARLAAMWLKREYERTGADCYLHHYFTGFAPNVICSYAPSFTDVSGGKNRTDLQVVVISAHYDDRGSFGMVRAPGADDDGSGSAALLNIARTIKRYGIVFEDHEVILAAFSGEEQGLWGSRFFAKKLRDEGRDVLFMLQADMLSYRKSGESLQVAYPPLTHTIEEGPWLITNISRLYTPQLAWGETSACCSDHQSFDDLGFASSWVFERAGPIADPAYHSSKDLSDRDNVDWLQLRLISSLMLALLLSITPFRI